MHQASGIADALDKFPTRLDFGVIQVCANKNDTCIGWSRRDPQRNGSAVMEADAPYFDWPADRRLVVSEQSISIAKVRRER